MREFPPLASFGEPMAILTMGEYEAMKQEVTCLQQELAITKGRLNHLGYAFIGSQMSLNIHKDPASVHDAVFVRVPEVKVRAEHQVWMPDIRKIRNIREEAERYAQTRETAIQLAMDHAARTWVRLFHERAAKASFEQPAMPGLGGT